MSLYMMGICDLRFDLSVKWKRWTPSDMTCCVMVVAGHHVGLNTGSLGAAVG